jgi:phytoene dehydrogenase-like protein
MAVTDGIVIGSGPNGLVAANLRADAGWDVEVLEAEPEPGGAVRSGETCEPGFVHDRFSSFYPFATISPPGREHFDGHGPRDLLAGTALHADLAPEAVGGGAFGWIMCGLGQTHGFPIPEGGSGALTRARADRLRSRGGRVRCGARVERMVEHLQPEAGRAACVHVTGGVDELTGTMAELATGRVPTTPFLVMGQYAATNPTRQPAGTETAWAYAHVPQGIEWQAGELERFADRMQRRIEAAAPGFGDLVRRRVVTGPLDLQAQEVKLAGGGIDGGTAHLHQLALFRPIPAQLGRPETPVGRLYLASASAHPSGGVHGAPGAIAARAAILRRAPWRLRKWSPSRHPPGGGKRRG